MPTLSGTLATGAGVGSGAGGVSTGEDLPALGHVTGEPLAPFPELRRLLVGGQLVVRLGTLDGCPVRVDGTRAGQCVVQALHLWVLGQRDAAAAGELRPHLV